MNCLPHLLNLSVKIVFEDEIIAPLLAKCRHLVGTFKHSTSLSEKLSETLRNASNLYYDEEVDQVNIDKSLSYINSEAEKRRSKKKRNLRFKLVQDICWNSTLAMLISVCDSHAAIRLIKLSLFTIFLNIF